MKNEKPSKNTHLIGVAAILAVGILVLSFFIMIQQYVIGFIFFAVICGIAIIGASFGRRHTERVDAFKADLDKLTPEELAELKTYSNQRDYIVEWKKKHPRE